jgi:peptide/nickel transport system permease protein
MRRLRKADFVRNARACGLGPLSVLALHLWPNLRRTMLGLAAFAAMETAALESGLAFLGLSLPPPHPTWGGMLADGLAYSSIAWWLAGAPAAALTITLVSLRIIAGREEFRTQR